MFLYCRKDSLTGARLNDVVLVRWAGTAVRLARYFGTTAQFWMNMQSSDELREAEGCDPEDCGEHCAEAEGMA